jgi:hypothetical protein
MFPFRFATHLWPFWHERHERKTGLNGGVFIFYSSAFIPSSTPSIPIAEKQQWPVIGTSKNLDFTG